MWNHCLIQIQTVSRIFFIFFISCVYLFYFSSKTMLFSFESMLLFWCILEYVQMGWCVYVFLHELSIQCFYVCTTTHYVLLKSLANSFLSFYFKMVFAFFCHNYKSVSNIFLGFYSIENKCLLIYNLSSKIAVFMVFFF